VGEGRYEGVIELVKGKNGVVEVILAELLVRLILWKQKLFSILYLARLIESLSFSRRLLLNIYRHRRANQGNLPLRDGVTK
jgi:hypothetical protein